MQLVALNKDTRILAVHADKGRSYRCPECLNSLRVRSGPHRQPHFFHLSSNPLCNQQGKTLFHLQTQLHILKSLPLEEAEMEIAFPEIGRIADVVWEAKKLIFEVQYSSITEQEVRQRTCDYESRGYQVVWILHEKRFNRRRLSAAEQFLVEKDCYFTSIDDKGKGVIYDQFAVVRNGMRLFKGPRLPISLANPFVLALNKDLSHELIFRTKRQLGFSGDFFDQAQKADPKDWAAMQRLQLRFAKRRLSFKRIKTSVLWLKNIYLSLLHALLEKHAI